MKNKFYLKEFKYFDGEEFVTFNIIDVQDEKSITVAVTDRGRISMLSYDLHKDEEWLYFEYGKTYARINITDFEEA